MNFRILFLSLFSTICLLSHCQQRGEILSSGTPPLHFKQVLDQLSIDESLEEKQKGEKKWEANSKADFQRESNFSLSRILSSGNVVYNNDITIYLQEVFDRVVPVNSRTREVSVYLLKTSTPNAFATHQGVVFVTVGLLAQLKNEAELAFILGHEYAHIQEQHGINKRLEQIQSIKERRQRGYRFADFVRHMSDYSKRLELAADSIAFELIVNSPYKIEESVGALEVLRYTHLPFEEVEFDLAFFESANFKIPSNFFLEIATSKDTDIHQGDDTLSTHPSIEDRIKAVADFKKLIEIQDKGYVSNKEEFFMARDRCREAVVRYQLANLEYIKSLYNAYVQHLKSPEDPYYLVAIAKSLYGYSKYRNAGEMKEVTHRYEAGMISRFYYFLQSMNSEQVSLIALRKMVEINETLNDQHVLQLIINLENDLEEQTNYKPIYLKFEPYVEIIIDSATVDSMINIAEKPNDKEVAVMEVPTIEAPILPTNELEIDTTREKLERFQPINWEEILTTEVSEEYSLDGTNKFHLHAFCDMDSASIMHIFNTLKDSVNHHDPVETEPEHADVREKKRLESQAAANQRKYGEALGIKNLLYVNPRAIFAHNIKGFNYTKTVKRTAEYLAGIKTAADQNDLNVTVLDPLSDDQLTRTLNGISTFSNLFGEMAEHHQIKFGTKIIPSEVTYTRPLEKQFGTRHVALAGMVHYQQRTPGMYPKLFLAALLTVYAPPFIAMTATPRNYTYLYHVTIDIRSGDVRDEDESFYTRRLSEKAISSIFNRKMVGMSRTSW